MNENFKKIKKQFLISALIKSAAAGVSAGLLCAGAVLLALKLSGIDISPLYYVLMGVVPALIVCGTLFVFLRPTDESIAKRLDYDFGLKEKVQTMVAYGNEDDDMVKVQRMDASESLAAITPKTFRLKEIWRYAVAAALAVAVFLTAVLISLPSSASAQPDPEEVQVPFKITQTEIDRMNALIDNVNSSDLDDQLKASVSDTIAFSLENIKEAEYVSQLQDELNKLVDALDAIADGVNTYKRIANSFVLKDNTRNFANAIFYSPTAYKKSVVFGISEYDDVKEYALLLEDAIISSVDTDFNVARNALNIEKAAQGDYSLYAAIENLTADIYQGLNRAGNLQDELTAAFTALAEDLNSKVKDVIDDYSDQALQQRIDEYFTTVKSKSVATLRMQAYNRLVIQEYTRSELERIFYSRNIVIKPVPDDELIFPDGSNDGNNNNGGDDDGNKDNPNGGSSGDGNTYYGSDDLVYDPETGEYVPYGQLLLKYQVIIDQMVKEGRLTPELEQFISYYFDLLWGETQKPDENQQ